MASILFSLALMLLSPALAAPTATKVEAIQSARLLDLVIRDYTFKSLNKHSIKTGIIHNVHLPLNLSGMEVDTARFRCGSLHRYGAQVKEFHVGVGVILQPCAERVMLVRQNLGINWSTIYYSNYDLSGYRLVSPVLGLLAYNVNANLNFSSPYKINILAGEKPIAIDFRNITKVDRTWLNKPMCAGFGDDGKVTLKTEVSPFVCAARNHGHFGLVVQSSIQENVKERRKFSRWKVVVGSCIGFGVGALLLSMVLVAAFVKVKRKAKREEMERRAYEEEALQVSMVGHIRALTASATRTLPNSIEHEYTP